MVRNAREGMVRNARGMCGVIPGTAAQLMIRRLLVEAFRTISLHIAISLSAGNHYIQVEMLLF